MTEQAAEFVQLKGYDDYEILSVYPFTIRRKDNHHEVKECNNTTGYKQVKLNGHKYSFHRLIALQFIPNDDPINKNVVDHINRNKTDNHINNLRWCSQSENSYNRTAFHGIQYEFIDDIPDDAMMIDYYETKQGIRNFEEHKYYYHYVDETDEDIFYCKITNNLYKTLHINQDKKGNQYVYMQDVNNKRVQLFINKFKFQRNLID